MDGMALDIMGMGAAQAGGGGMGPPPPKPKLPPGAGGPAILALTGAAGALGAGAHSRSMAAVNMVCRLLEALSRDDPAIWAQRHADTRNADMQTRRHANTHARTHTRTANAKRAPHTSAVRLDTHTVRRPTHTCCAAGTEHANAPETHRLLEQVVHGGGCGGLHVHPVLQCRSKTRCKGPIIRGRHTRAHGRGGHAIVQSTRAKHTCATYRLRG
jgi:hypothetical protein